jgi:hypothetical protein
VKIIIVFTITYHFPLPFVPSRQGRGKVVVGQPTKGDLLEWTCYLTKFRLVHSSPVGGARDVERRRCKITIDGLFSGYKIAGNLARRKAAGFIYYQHCLTLKTWHYWTIFFVSYLPGSFLM